MAINLKDGSLKRLFTGLYNYSLISKNGRTDTYAQERFTSYALPFHYSKIMESELITRISTGELLIIQVIYVINMEGTPKDIKIIRTLGATTTTEEYEYNSSNNRILLSFHKDGNTTATQGGHIVFNGRSYVATPTLITSALFLQYKKNKANTTNTYYIIKSPNDLIFKGMPTSAPIDVKKAREATEIVALEGVEAKGNFYHIWPNQPGVQNGIDNSAKIFISEHLNIPVLLEYNNIRVALDKIEEFQE
jgi:hypothetical protein